MQWKSTSLYSALATSPMLSYFRVLDPNIERIIDIGFSPPKDYGSMSLEDEKNLSLDALASNEFCKFLSDIVLESIIPLRYAPCR